MSKSDVRKQLDRLQAQLEAVERELGEEPDVIEAEVVELPSEDEPLTSAGGPMGSTDLGEHSEEDQEEPAISVPAVIERPRPQQWSEQWWDSQSLATQARRCKGHKKTGERCRQPALQGTTVCRYHGGAAPHVIAAARARLANAADSMASNLVGLAKSAESEAVRVRATEGVLDRVGIGRTTEVQVGPTKMKPYEEIYADIQGGSRAESRARRGIDDQAYTDTYGYEAGIDPGDQSRSFLDGYGDGGEHSEPSFHPPTPGEPQPKPRCPHTRRIQGPVDVDLQHDRGIRL